MARGGCQFLYDLPDQIKIGVINFFKHGDIFRNELAVPDEIEEPSKLFGKILVLLKKQEGRENVI
jgi:hypothetical protein